MSEAYTKTDLVKELALAAQISKRCAERVLESLMTIAYREAPHGFAIPGICRLDVVERKARLVRNPRTNQTLQIDAHRALRVRPVKRAKDAIAPTPRAITQVVAELAAATPPSPGAPLTDAPANAPAPVAETTAATTAATTAQDEVFLSFRCKQCRQEIESPFEMAGSPNECPTCGESLTVPFVSEPGTVWHQERTTAATPLVELNPSVLAAMKGRTIRIELPDDL
jgi:DNA-binding protein HU-beta